MVSRHHNPTETLWVVRGNDRDWYSEAKHKKVNLLAKPPEVGHLVGHSISGAEINVHLAV